MSERKVKFINTETQDSFEILLDDNTEYEYNLLGNLNTVRIIRKVPYTDIESGNPWALRDQFLPNRNTQINRIVICENDTELPIDVNDSVLVSYNTITNVNQFVNSVAVKCLIEQLSVVENLS